MKICGKCRQNKDSADFTPDKSKKDGLSSHCKSCHKETAKACYEANKTEISQKGKQYYQDNKAKINARNKAYYEAHKEEASQFQKQYQVDNSARIKKVRRAWRQRNQDHIREDRNRRWREDPNFRLSVSLRNRISAVLAGRRKYASTLALLGCTYGEARSHIASQFTNGMSWENHGEWHIDHIKPLRGKGIDLSDPAQLAELCHYTNLQPLWGAENIAKSNRMPA